MDDCMLKKAVGAYVYGELWDVFGKAVGTSCDLSCGEVVGEVRGEISYGYG